MGDREGYRERVREREGKRWRVNELNPHNLTGETSMDHPIGEGLG